MEQEEKSGYMYNPLLRWLREEKYILLSVAAVVLLVLAYRHFFPSQHIEQSRMPKYGRVLGELDALTDAVEKAREEELEKKNAGRLGALVTTDFKMKLYQTYDYMFVWEMREDSPFYGRYPRQEKDLIRHLQMAGKHLDSALIRVFEASGNPETPINFPRIRDEIEAARRIYKKEGGG